MYLLYCIDLVISRTVKKTKIPKPYLVVKLQEMEDRMVMILRLVAIIH